jgi:hypothetical protein
MCFNGKVPDARQMLLFKIKISKIRTPYFQLNNPSKISPLT